MPARNKKQLKYLVLGAGPAGLSFANYLKKSGENSFLVLEKENEAGGLCRSKIVDNYSLDIGGGHFLDVRIPKVNEFLFMFMPRYEWNLYNRNSKIQLGKEKIDHPLEANIWQLSVNEQVEYLSSIAKAGCNTEKLKPENFMEWINWKFGEKISKNYMLPYNKKMFGKNLSAIGTYWLEKLPEVSLEETLRSCLEKKFYGQQPGHVQFYYPKKYGYGELWLRMAKSIEEHIEYNVVVNKLDFETKKVNDFYRAENIITTIPWNCIGNYKKLKHTSVQIEYFPNNLKSKAHWIYEPNLDIPYHRILLRNNFCKKSNGYWTETNLERVRQTTCRFKYINEFAYPLNTIDKPKEISKLLSFAISKRVFGLGRWGEHQHYNSDTTVQRAIDLARRFI